MSVKDITEEELAVIHECGVEGLKRGLAVAVVSLALSKFVVKKYGHVSKYIRPGLVVWPMTSLGLYLGFYSNRGNCREKIMALENSPLGERLRLKAGLSSGEKVESEFSTSNESSNTQTLYSPLNKQSQSESTWEEIRKLWRQKQSPVETGSTERGVSFDELRRRHRSNQENDRSPGRSLTPEEEEDLERKNNSAISPETASFRSKQFQSDASSALDFSRSDEDRMKSSTFAEHRQDVEQSEIPGGKQYRKVTRKNEYGDEIE